ncbi:hypothetical protein D1872_306980 [compost metagenome]
MALEHGLDYFVPDALRHYGFDADFFRSLHLSLLSDIRIGPLAGHESAVTFNVKAAVAVIADRPRSGVQDGIQYPFVVILRHENDELVQMVGMNVLHGAAAPDP